MRGLGLVVSMHGCVVGVDHGTVLVWVCWHCLVSVYVAWLTYSFQPYVDMFRTLIQALTPVIYKL